MEKTVKGMFLKNIVDSVMREKGPEGLAALKNDIGAIHYYGIKNYPLDEEVRLQHAAMKLLYGGVSNEHYREFGTLQWDLYVGSVIGKTMMSLFKNDILRLALKVADVLNTVSDGFEITAKETSPTSVTIMLANIPYPIEYYEGVWFGALEYFKQSNAIKDGKIVSRTIKTGTYEYDLSWEFATAQ